MNRVLSMLIFNHAFCFVTTAFREIFTGSVFRLALFMYFFEVASIFYQTVVMLILTKTIVDVSVLNGPQEALAEQIAKHKDVPHCSNVDQIKNWCLTTKSWLLLEVGVFYSYYFTLLLLMIKSRCMSIGIDQKKQFDPFYLSLMAD